MPNVHNIKYDTVFTDAIKSKRKSYKVTDDLAFITDEDSVASVSSHNDSTIED